MLEAVPGLTGALAPDRDKSDALVHLRLTLSAAELALLPFELARGAGRIERHRPSRSRRVRPSRSRATSARCRPMTLVWPPRPRVLFVSGDPDNIPFDEHRAALVAAIQPFQYPDRDEATGEATDARRAVRRSADHSRQPDARRTAARVQRAVLHAHPHPDARRPRRDVAASRTASCCATTPGRPTSCPANASSAPSRASVIARRSSPSRAATAATSGSVVIPGASFAHAVHRPASRSSSARSSRSARRARCR